MKPEKIRALLAEKKVKQVEIKRALGLKSTGTVSRVIDRHFVSRRVQAAIAERLGVPFEKIWGKAV